MPDFLDYTLIRWCSIIAGELGLWLLCHGQPYLCVYFIFIVVVVIIFEW